MPRLLELLLRWCDWEDCWCCRWGCCWDRDSEGECDDCWDEELDWAACSDDGDWEPG